MEKFFLTCFKIDTEEIEEIILRRYQNIDYILKFGIVDFAKFCKKAKEKEEEEKTYMQWCAMLPRMAKYITYGEFKDMLTVKIDTRPAEEIIEEIEKLHGKEALNGS